MSEFQAIHPATGAVVARYEGHDRQTVSQRIRTTHATWQAWSKTSVEERAAPMRAVAGLLRARRSRYAELITSEMGKPVKQSLAEVDKCAMVCEYYADRAAEFLRPEPVEMGVSHSYVAYRPLGVVLAVMPWNFPFWQVFRFAAPALMAGNAGLLKHASNVPGCALAIEQVFQDGGFPPDLFRTLLISSQQVEGVLDHPEIAAATLTGSTEAGRSLAGLCGRRLKKTVLELGGSDPYLVLSDADIAASVETCVESRLLNTGQSCISAKRFVVVDAVHDMFVERFVASMAAKQVGDPHDEGTDVGPLARRDLRDELHKQVEASLSAGARCLLGGTLPDGPGAFYPPTLLTEVRPGMPAYEQELFGPVAAIIRAQDEADAIRIANDSPFGLGAAVFTGDLERGRRIAEQELNAGSTFVNALVRSDPRLPFGGVKQSGYGRELGREGIREFVNIKSVYVA